MRRVYCDHAATTKIDPEVLEVMIHANEDAFGNASSVYYDGRNAHRALDQARETVAQTIDAKAGEIYFTSGGTEADNWAILGAARANRKKGNHIITSAIEHHAVLHTCQALEKEGFEATYLPVDETGLIHPQTLQEALKDETILVSIMLANNEVGTIEPIRRLCEIAKEAGALFHTDAVQAFGQIPVSVQDLGVDLLSLSAHKIYGPKGVGALYIKKGTKIETFMHGGAQENNRRAGTENIPAIVAFARAAQLAVERLPATEAHLMNLRERMIDGAMSRLDYIRLNGHRDLRLPGNVNFSVEFAEGEALLLNLDILGVEASSGSACTSGSLDPSHVLLAMGLPHEVAHGSLRFSFGMDNTEDDIDYCLEQLIKTVERIRAMSPLQPS